MAGEGDTLDLCPHCGGGRLHPGDRIAIAETADPATARSIRTLARQRGLRVVLRSGPGVITLDPGSAQRRIEEICPSGAGERWLRRGSGSLRASPEFEGPANQAADVPAPTHPGRPHRPMLRHPVSRDPLFWLGAVGALVLGVLGSWWSVGLPDTLAQQGAPLAQDRWLRLAPDLLSPTGLAALLIAIGWLIAWLLLTWIPARLRRSVYRRMDAEALLLPPSDRLPGWHSDPVGLGVWRWWNGLSWTGAVHPTRRTGWLWPIGPVLAVTAVLCMLPVWVTTPPSVTIPPWSVGLAPASPDPSPTPLRYRAILRDVDEALLSYSAAAADDPLGSRAATAFDALRRAGGRLAAVTIDEPDARGDRRALVDALDAYIAVHQARAADAAQCAPDRPDVSACRREILRAWQGRVDATIEPLAQRYAAVVTAESQ